jgi:hypothetical protein
MVRSCTSGVTDGRLLSIVGLFTSLRTSRFVVLVSTLLAGTAFRFISVFLFTSLVVRDLSAGIVRMPVLERSEDNASL